MFSPSSNLKLLENVDLSKDYRNTFTFLNATTQYSFFLSKVKSGLAFTNFTYLKKEQKIKVDINVENLWNVNYLMFQNSNFGSKWFYGFITNVEYLNDSTSLISYEIDVMQTWKFDIEYKDSFVEREHVADDTIGANTVNENLDTGEYKNIDIDVYTGISSLSIIVGSIGKPDGLGGITTEFGAITTGVYSGVSYYVFDSDLTGVGAVNQFLLDMDTAGKGDNVVVVFMIPKNLLPSYSNGDRITSASSTKLFPTGITKPLSSIDGYTPRNNKLFIYPYNFLYVSNNNGSSAIYHYEFFDGSTCDFTVEGNISPNPTVSLSPDYKLPSSYLGANDEESLKLSDFPICAYTSNSYANWLGQNAVSVPVSIASSGLALASGIATGNPLAISGGVIGVASTIGNFVEAKLKPDVSKGSLSGSLNVAKARQTFTFYKRQITSEYARIIDDYFNKFGYKVNRVKTPNFETRPNWNFLKLREPNIYGNIPNDDLVKIRKVFEDGITFWHNDNVGNYNRTNK